MTESKYITFLLPIGTEYNTELKSFKHQDSTINITIEVNPEVWEFIDMIMMFNLGWDDRNAGTVSGSKNVNIKMFLDPSVYNNLILENNLTVNEVDFLETNNQHPMRSTKNWFATEVTEEIDLPEELKSLGTVREGFTTKWSK